MILKELSEDMIKLMIFNLTFYRGIHHYKLESNYFSKTHHKTMGSMKFFCDDLCVTDLIWDQVKGKRGFILTEVFYQIP